MNNRPETIFPIRKRAVTPLKMDGFCPLTIPYHSSPITICMQNLKNSVNKFSSYRSEMVSMDGRMDRRTDTERYNIIPRHTLVAGYKKLVDTFCDDK